MMPRVSQTPPKCLSVVFCIGIFRKPFLFCFFVQILDIKVDLVAKCIEWYLTRRVPIVSVLIHSNHNLGQLASVWQHFSLDLRFIVNWFPSNFPTNGVNFGYFGNYFLQPHIDFPELLLPHLVIQLRPHLQFKLFLIALSLLGKLLFLLKHLLLKLSTFLR